MYSDMHMFLKPNDSIIQYTVLDFGNVLLCMFSGSVKFSFDKLKTYLLEAVTVLPDGSLKDVLQKQSKENADHLWK